MDLTAYTIITFDCFGTLIDWEHGIVAALRPILRANRVEIEDDEIIRLYSRLEGDAEESANVEYRTYREVLGEVMERFADEFKFALRPGEREALANSLPSWPVFPDTVAALRKLRRRAYLGILSNIDDDLLAATKPNLGIDFHTIITAQFCRSYKPAEKHWKAMRALTQIPKEQALHVAESRFHDVIPARAMGYSTVWVNRRGAAGKHGGGASEGDREISPYEAQPDLEVPDLETLARLVENAWSEKRF